MGKMLIHVDEVAQLLEVSKPYAYKLIRKLNDELKRKGDGIDSITYERFLEENPKATLQDFREWLAVIELMTLEERRANWRQTHKNCRFIDETKHAPCAPSAEEAYITGIEEEEAEERRLMKLSLVKQALKSMSSKQRRRYLLHVARGLTTRQVGQLEGVAPSVAHRSIKRAERIIHRYIAKIIS